MNLPKEVVEKIMEAHELADFMKVPMPDVILKDAFYYDKDGKGLLEIYSHASNKFEKTEENGKIAWLITRKEYCQDVKKVVEVKGKFIVDRTEDFTQRQNRLAEVNDEDFKVIYNREFERSGNTDTPEVHRKFKEILFAEVTRLIKTHTERNEYRDQKAGLLHVAESFLDYLSGSTTEANETLQEQPEQEIPKAKTKHHILSYLLESHAMGKHPVEVNGKTEIERIARERHSYTGSPNTFYKNYDSIKKRDLNSNSALTEIGGYEWRKVILSISEHPNQLDKYLTSKGL